MYLKILLLLALTPFGFSQNNFRFPGSFPDNKYVEIYPKIPKMAKIEREYRPKNKEEFFEITKPKLDEITFKIDDNSNENVDYKIKYVKIPVEEKHNFTERPIKYENTIEKYRALTNGPEFVTSRNFQKQKKFEEGFFTKINTVIRNQISKIFKPFEKNVTEDSRKFSKTRYGTVERIQEKKKDKRFLSIFTILQFENSRCQAQGTFLSYEGTCYHRSECAQLGGFSMGACAKGYGVCCICKLQRSLKILKRTPVYITF